MNFQGGRGEKNKKKTKNKQTAVTLWKSIENLKFSMGVKKKTKQNKCVLKTKTKRGMSAERVQDPTETNYMVTHLVLEMWKTFRGLRL